MMPDLPCELFPSQPPCCTCIISGNGCGHTVLGTESGTLASQNYPGTYPSNTWCKWRLRVPEGRMLRLLFGDFDIESSPGCSNGSLVITDKNGEPSLGKTDSVFFKCICVWDIIEVLSCLLFEFFSEIPANRLYVPCHYWRSPSHDCGIHTGHAIPLTHRLKRQTQFRNKHMHVFQPGVSSRVLRA